MGPAGCGEVPLALCGDAAVMFRTSETAETTHATSVLRESTSGASATVSDAMGDEYSQELIDVAFAALDHGIDSVREGGPLIPFVMSETGSERTLTRFAADMLEEGLEQVIAHVVASERSGGRPSCAGLRRLRQAPGRRAVRRDLRGRSRDGQRRRDGPRTEVPAEEGAPEVPSTSATHALSLRIEQARW